MQTIIEKPFLKLPDSSDNSRVLPYETQIIIQQECAIKQQNPQEQKLNTLPTHPHEQYFGKEDVYDSFEDYKNGYSSSFYSQRLINTSF